MIETLTVTLPSAPGTNNSILVGEGALDRTLGLDRLIMTLTGGPYDGSKPPSPRSFRL